MYNISVSIEEKKISTNRTLLCPSIYLVHLYLHFNFGALFIEAKCIPIHQLSVYELLLNWFALRAQKNFFFIRPTSCDHQTNLTEIQIKKKFKVE